MNFVNINPKLSIPSGDNIKEKMYWRLALIKKHNVYSALSLKNDLVKASNKKLSDRRKKNLIKTALSDEFRLDDVERTILFVTKILLDAKTRPPESVLQLNEKALRETKRLKMSLAEYAETNPIFLSSVIEEQISLGQCYLENELPKMRAKLAFQEIVTRIAPNELIPFMVSISPKYLESPFTGLWLRSKQGEAWFGHGTNKDDAKNSLNELSKAIQGDKRQFNQRKYDYWAIDRKYQKLSSKIMGLRKKKKLFRSDKVYLNEFCKAWNIPQSYLRRIFDDKVAPKSLVLEIFTEQELIEDPKAFRTFQTKISKLKEKHEYVEMMLIVENLLDFQINNPQFFHSYNCLSLLEKIEL